MLHSAASPRRGQEAGGTTAELDSARGRSKTPREQYQQRQRNHFQTQRPRSMYKTPEMPSYFPPHIQDHGRWEAEGYSTFGPPPRFGVQRKEALDFHTLPVLKQPHKNIFDGSGDSPDAPISEEKYRAQLRTFPELPQLAHERIREFGNEIVASYSAQLCKFLNDALIESTTTSYAVFTKKSRTGQRWLMVFRSEKGRVNISFNKLLTNQLLVRCLNPVSVEVESARGVSNGPHETCVFTFANHTEANKFVHDIHESQTIVWNHREMFLEQTLRGGPPNPAEFYMDGPLGYGFYSPRPLSARSSSSGYYLPDMPHAPLTPRTRALPPVPRAKRSPFTVSGRTTPRSELDENWRIEAINSSIHAGSATELEIPGSPTSVTQSPIRKRSKGNNKETFVKEHNPGGSGDGDFVYNSMTHAMALQQSSGPKMASPSPRAMATEASPMKEVSTSRRFQVTDIQVSNKRDVGTGAPDEEFFPLGSGELQMIDNGEEQFDEIKCFTSSGQLLFAQTLFGWNKVRCPEDENHTDTSRCWWIGAAILGNAALKHSSIPGGDAPRIREFKGTFTDDKASAKFTEMFHEGAVKGNNPEVRKRYFAQSLRI